MSQSAQQAEAADAPVTVKWQNKEWTVPPAKKWPPRVLHYIDRDKVTLALETILGPEQYETWLDLDLPLVESSELFDELAKAVGLDNAGE